VNLSNAAFPSYKIGSCVATRVGTAAAKATIPRITILTTPIGLRENLLQKTTSGDEEFRILVSELFPSIDVSVFSLIIATL
jgi:hypothetical protein